MVNMPNVLAVDREGHRMINEQFTTRSSSGAMSADTLAFGSRFYSILDKAQVDKIAKDGFPSYLRITGLNYFGQGGVLMDMPIPEMDEVMENAIKAGLVFKADTIAELADMIGTDPSTLVATVNRYNEICDNGVDEDFSKPSEYLEGLNTGPFYAITGCQRPFHIPGGINIDTKFRVLRADNPETPIYGLYAICGDSANVIYSDYAHYPGGGRAQGWTVTSGRLSGVSAAEYIAEG
jgi:fumarate reductase flavoprotein subunit